jgi:hypothetical protein
VDLSAAHWVYLAGVVVIIIVMTFRQNVVVPAVAATFLTAWVFTGNLVTGLSSVFNASLIAAQELFSIFLIIALVTALLGALRALGADKRMVRPFQRVMRNGTLAFVVLSVVTYAISLFFWPTPAVPLIGAVLLPAAIRAGLPAMGAAMAIAISGQGMALSSDYIIQVAPGLSATAAGVPPGEVADKALVLSLVTGITALVLAFLQVRKTILAPSLEHLRRWEDASVEGFLLTDEGGRETATKTADVVAGGGGTPPGRTVENAADTGGESQRSGLVVPTSGRSGAPTLPTVPAEDPEEEQGPFAIRRSKAFALLTPLTFAALIAYMVLGKFTGLVPELEGGAAASLVGGSAAVLLLAATITLDGRRSLETCATHVVDGLVFAFKAMGVVIPIAGFFFIGNADFVGRIVGLPEDAQAPGFLIDLVSAAQPYLPENAFVLSFGLLLVGMATGLDGSGFSGLPLTGSLAGALAPGAGADPATLAAIGQMGAVWSGGGVLIAWSSLLAVAGFARVPVIDLARHCFLPVMAGLVIATLVAALAF